MCPIARTVLGDLDPTELGVVYAHEHLALNSALIAAAFPHILLDDLDAAVAEVKDCSGAGVKTMVDAMPCAAGRDVEMLAQISYRTGVNVIASTGLHHFRYYGPRHWSAQLAPTELAELFISDIVEGVDCFDYTGPVVRRTEHRAGVIKVATAEVPTPRDRRVLEAAARAHRFTGAPILTHCEGGLGASEQIALLGEAGVDATSILCSHVDKVRSLQYHMEIASTGAFLEYDQALRQAGDDCQATVELVVSMVANGYGAQILLGTDGARRGLWRHLGGWPGLAWLAEKVPALLEERGLTHGEVHSLFVDNPARAFAMRPPAEPTGTQAPHPCNALPGDAQEVPQKGGGG